jgi:hypothetical protein
LVVLSLRNQVMIIASKHLQGVCVVGSEGAAGCVLDVLFDDRSWHVKYLVVRLGGRLSAWHVLLKPDLVTHAAWTERELHVPLSGREFRQLPGVQSDPPVAYRQELQAARFSAWEAGRIEDVVLDGDPHLRNMRAVTGHRVEASDGPVGRIAEFIIDDEYWTVRYVVVNTGRLLPSLRVLIAPTWVETISWEDRVVRLSATREELESSHEPATV